MQKILTAALIVTGLGYAQAGEWTSYGLTPGETRYSPLNQINTGNVKRVGLAWSYAVGSGGGGQEATPLFWNGTVYGITNWSVVFAVDARTGKERWRWDPEVNQTAVRPKICCGVVNRGLAIYQGMIIAPVIDGRLQALDADTGKTVWQSPGRMGENAAILNLGGKVLVFLTNDAKLIVQPASAKTYSPVVEYTVAASPTWAHPLVLGRKILIKDETSLRSLAIEGK